MKGIIMYTMKRFCAYFFLLLLVICTIPFAKDTTSVSDSNNVQLNISGRVAMEEGQMQKAHYIGPYSGVMPYPVWNHRDYAQIRLDAYVNSRLHIIVAPQVKLWTNTYAQQKCETDQSSRPFRTWSYVSIADGEGIINFGKDLNNPTFQLATGVMPYKYNEDAQNLGEYLFRSGTYPCYITTSFDFAYATLSGLRLSSNLFNNKLHQDILLTTETQIQPLYDWSLSYLVSYKEPGFFNVGAGINLDRWFPMSNNTTKPKTTDNIYYDENGTRSYYTFTGMKLMAYASIDPKHFMPKDFASIFGEEDWKIFGEVAVLGVRNYEAFSSIITPDTVGGVPTHDTAWVSATDNNYYKDITKRIPIMLGFNFPACHILDVLSLQAEWYKWNYFNSYYFQFYQGAIPEPTSIKGDVTASDLKDGYLKWSVYGKKEIIKGFTVTGQIAYDHTFHAVYYELQKSDVEAFIKKGEWGWWLKFGYAF